MGTERIIIKVIFQSIIKSKIMEPITEYDTCKKGNQVLRNKCFYNIRILRHPAHCFPGLLVIKKRDGEGIEYVPKAFFE